MIPDQPTFPVVGSGTMRPWLSLVTPLNSDPMLNNTSYLFAAVRLGRTANSNVVCSQLGMAKENERVFCKVRGDVGVAPIFRKAICSCPPRLESARISPPACLTATTCPGKPV